MKLLAETTMFLYIIVYICLFHDHSYLLLKTKWESFRHYFSTYNLDDDDEIQSVFRARAYEIESCLHPDFSVSFCEPQKRWRSVVDASAFVIVRVTQPVYRHQQQRSIKRCYQLSVERLLHFRQLQRTLLFHMKWFLKLLFLGQHLTCLTCNFWIAISCSKPFVICKIVM